MDGFPYKGSVRDVQLHRERLRLHPDRSPHVIIRWQYGYVGYHVGVLQHRAHPGPVVIQQVHIFPPRVLLVVERAVLHPSRKCSILRGIVEPVPDGMRYAGECTHVRAQLQEFQRCREHLVGICHLFSAHDPFASQGSRRRDIFINHRVSSSPAVILVSHLFPELVLQPVGRPRLPFRDVHDQRTLQREESSAIRLVAGFHPIVSRPFGICFRKSFVEQFGLGELEIEANPVHLLLEFRAFLRAVVEILHVSEPADFEHGERQPRQDVVATAVLEFRCEIGSPVTAFKFHAVHEESSQMLRKRSDACLNDIRHVIQVGSHCLGVHVVEYGASCARRSVYHRSERVVFHQRIELPFPFWHINADGSILESIGDIDSFAERAYRVRDQIGRDKCRNPALIHDGHPRVKVFEYAEFREFKRLPAVNLAGVG